MASFRHPRSVGLTLEEVNTDDGTTARTYHAPPGSVGLRAFDEYLIEGRESVAAGALRRGEPDDLGESGEADESDTPGDDESSGESEQA